MCSLAIECVLLCVWKGLVLGGGLWLEGACFWWGQENTFYNTNITLFSLSRPLPLPPSPSPPLPLAPSLSPSQSHLLPRRFLVVFSVEILGPLYTAGTG